MLFPQQLYTREEVWRLLKPGVPFRRGGMWATGYAVADGKLVAFANIGDSGRTGHDFPNAYDPASNLMTWYGKPDAHSAQPTFRRLFFGELKLMMFVRWDNKNPNWLYLGMPSIESYKDNVETDPETKTIEIKLRFIEPTWQDEAVVLSDDLIKPSIEGSRKTVLVNRYERDPKLRAAAILFHGVRCAVCDFDFEENYGPVGRGFCHVHHLIPLGETEAPQLVDPKTDLVPLCANCHSMVHRQSPAMTISELKAMLRTGTQSSN